MTEPTAPFSFCDLFWVKVLTGLDHEPAAILRGRVVAEISQDVVVGEVLDLYGRSRKKISGAIEVSTPTAAIVMRGAIDRFSASELVFYRDEEQTKKIFDRCKTAMQEADEPKPEEESATDV